MRVGEIMSRFVASTITRLSSGRLFVMPITPGNRDFAHYDAYNLIGVYGKNQWPEYCFYNNFFCRFGDVVR